MAEVKHTPGEWRLDTAPSGRAYGVSAITPLGLRVPVVVWRGVAQPASDQGQANARLIAAAPGLLAAAKQAFYSEVGLTLADAVESAGWAWPDSAPATVSPLAERLRAALSKATAQQEGR